MRRRQRASARCLDPRRQRLWRHVVLVAVLLDDKIERPLLAAGGCIGYLHLELLQVVAVLDAVGVVGEVELRGQGSADSLHLDMNMLSLARLITRWNDRLHPIAAAVIRHGIALQAI